MIRLDAFEGAPTARIDEDDRDGDPMAALAMAEFARRTAAVSGPDIAIIPFDTDAADAAAASGDPHAWKDGACTPICDVTRRDASGKVVSGACSCMRITGLRDTPSGPKVNTEPCDCGLTNPNPNERNDTMRTRTDASDATDNFERDVAALRLDSAADSPTDPVVRARAKRDADARVAWRVDAAGAKARPKLRAKLRAFLGDDTSEDEFDATVRHLDNVKASGLTGDAARTALLAVRGMRANGTRTDANDDDADRALAAARADRDARALRAGR